MTFKKYAFSFAKRRCLIAKVSYFQTVLGKLHTLISSLYSTSSHFRINVVKDIFGDKYYVHTFFFFVHKIFMHLSFCALLLKTINEYM